MLKLSFLLLALVAVATFVCVQATPVRELRESLVQLQKRAPTSGSTSYGSSSYGSEKSSKAQKSSKKPSKKPSKKSSKKSSNKSKKSSSSKSKWSWSDFGSGDVISVGLDQPCPDGFIEVFSDIPSSASSVWVSSDENCPPGFSEESAPSISDNSIWIPMGNDCPPDFSVAIVGQTLNANGTTNDPDGGNSTMPTSSLPTTATSNGVSRDRLPSWVMATILPITLSIGYLVSGGGF